MIECNYSIASLSPKIIGTYLKKLYVSGGNYFVSENLHLSGENTFYIRFFDKSKDEIIQYSFNSKGTESLAGNLHGFKIDQVESIPKEARSKNYSWIHTHWEECKVLRILAYGEKLSIIMDDEYTINTWNKVNPNNIVNQLKVEKKTIDFIAIELSNARWIYISSRGEYHYTIDFNKSESPEEFIKEMLYAENDQDIRLLEVIE